MKNLPTKNGNRGPTSSSGKRQITSFLPSWSLRILSYYNRHGFRRLLKQTAVVLWRIVFQNRRVLYSCDLRTVSKTTLDGDLRVERKEKFEDIDERDWNLIATALDVERAQRSCRKHFKAGASMWVIRAGESLAGYGWTLTGGSLDPHFYPLGKDDVHLFDFLILPQCRGRHINSFLVNSILSQLAAESKARAYIETWEWNRPMLRSLRRTSFQQVALARKVTLLGHTFVEWTRVTRSVADPPPQQSPNGISQ